MSIDAPLSIEQSLSDLATELAGGEITTKLDSLGGSLERIASSLERLVDSVEVPSRNRRRWWAWF